MRTEVKQKCVESRTQPDAADYSETDPVNYKECVASDPLDVDLMLAWDVPECEKRDENQGHQSDCFLVVEETPLVDLKECRHFEDAILDGQDGVSPQFNILSLLS